MSALVRSTALMMAAAAAFGGDLTARYQLALDRVERGGPPRFDKAFVTADAEPRHVRRFTEFSGDVSGRYLDAMAYATRFHGVAAARWRPVLDEVLKLQKPDGHFGAALEAGKATDATMAVLWGNGRMLVGLLEAYDATGDAAVLAAATRLGGWLTSMAPLINSAEVLKMFNDGKAAVGYICWTQNVEGLVRLYLHTKNPAFLDLAKDIAARTEMRPGQHSHGHLASLRGIVLLYEATRDAQWLARVETQYQTVIETGNLLPEGAVAELYKPQVKRDEGCSEADWLRLSMELYRVTGKRAYLAQAEKTLFNEMALNQFANGDYGHRSRTEADIAVQPGYVSSGGWAQAWWCCLFHGLRAVEEVLRTVFAAGPESMDYLMPVDGRGAGKGLEWAAESRLETEGRVTLRIEKGAGAATLRVRVPEWASVEAAIGNSAAGRVEGEWLRLDRVWKTGERVELRYRMKTRSEAFEKKAMTLWHGPWLLGVDRAASPAFFHEPHLGNRVLLPASVTVLPTGTLTENAFTVPVAHFEVSYEPGGYRIQPQKALLRPLAEQTGLAPTAWQFVFQRAE